MIRKYDVIYKIICNTDNKTDILKLKVEFYCLYYILLNDCTWFAF